MTRKQIKMETIIKENIEKTGKSRSWVIRAMIRGGKYPNIIEVLHGGKASS